MPADPSTREVSGVSETSEVCPRVSSLTAHFRAEVDITKNDFTIGMFCFVVSIFDAFGMLIHGSLVNVETDGFLLPNLALVPQDATKRHFYLKSVIIIGSFCFGSAFFILFYRFLDIRCRFALCFLSTMLLALVITAATLVNPRPPYKDYVNEWHGVLAFCLFVFQSSGQVVTTRALGFRGWIGFSLKALHWGTLVFLLVESYVGLNWSYGNIGIKNVLWSAVFAKTFMATACLFWDAVALDCGDGKTDDPHSDEGTGNDSDGESTESDNTGSSSSPSSASNHDSSSDSSNESSSDDSSSDDASSDDSSDNDSSDDE